MEVEYRTSEEVEREIKRVFPKYREESVKNICLKFIEDNLRIRRGLEPRGLVKISKELEEELRCEKYDDKYVKSCKSFEIKSIEYKEKIAELRIRVEVIEGVKIGIKGHIGIEIDEEEEYNLVYGVYKEKIRVCKECGEDEGECECGGEYIELNRAEMIGKEVEIRC